MTTDTDRRTAPLDLGTRYVFERVLGRGGMGVVLRAQDTLLNRLVAVKLLSDELADNPEAQQIFLTESRALATLSHPNLVGIFDVTEIDGRAMMVFEYVEGETLEQLLKKGGQFDEAEALRVAIELTFAIEYLHGKNVIHRDLKPANVMVQPDGKVRLIDFGLARSLEDIAERGTRLRGSPAYMAPEQVMGEALGHHTDLYALGMTLFEILAARLPFETGDMSFAQVHRHPPSLGTLRDGLHPDLVIIVDRCICKSRSDRPPSALEVRKILTTIATDVAAGVRPTQSRLTAVLTNVDFSTAAEDLSRNKGLVGLLAGITAVFILVLVVVLMFLKMIPMPGADAPKESVAVIEEVPKTVLKATEVPVNNTVVLDTVLSDGIPPTKLEVQNGIQAAETASDVVAAVVDELPVRTNIRKISPRPTEPKVAEAPVAAVEAPKPVIENPVGEPETFQPTKFGSTSALVSAEEKKAAEQKEAAEQKKAAEAKAALAARAQAEARAKADALLKEKQRLEAAKKKAAEKPEKVAPPVSF